MFKFSFTESDIMETEMKEGRRPKSIKKLMKEGKVDLKELKQLKKERKAAKETKLLARLEQSKGVLEAAKPVPKNMVSWAKPVLWCYMVKERSSCCELWGAE